MLYLHGHAARGRKLNKAPDYIVDDVGCWIWQKARKSTGYGHLWNGDRHVPAHRHYYELHVALIPEGMEVHHRCGVKLCVNPEHLEPLTRVDHMRLDGRAVPGQPPRGISAR